jgi:hypothetical protein
MDAPEEIEALVGHEGRAPGTDAERRAAGELERRLRDVGREAELEHLDAWPAWHLNYAFLVLLAVLGSVLSVAIPVLGALIVLLAVVLLLLDATGIALTSRRLLGRRASQNVVSREDGDKPGTVVLVAHYDAGRTGFAFSRRVEERRAAIGQRVRRPVGPLHPLLWAMLAVLACTILRVPGIESVTLTAIQFVPTAALIVALPLLIDIALSPVSPGANDNASGVAAALRLAERHGGRLEHFDVWVLLTGAQEALANGMRAFVRSHREDLDKERTVFINLDEVGHGTVRYTSREGLALAVRSHPQLVELCDGIAEDDEDAFGARALTNRAASDGYTARSAGYPAITVTCRNALDYTPEHHQLSDTAERIDPQAVERAVGFCSELLERLDAEVGEDLASHPEETVLSEEEQSG